MRRKPYSDYKNNIRNLEGKGNLAILLSIMDKTMEQSTGKKNALSNTINQLDLTHSHRTLHTRDYVINVHKYTVTETTSARL